MRKLSPHVGLSLKRDRLSILKKVGLSCEAVVKGKCNHQDRQSFFGQLPLATTIIVVIKTDL
jgi:hypothetical protein